MPCVTPLITGSAAETAREIVDAVATALRDQTVHDVDPALRGPDIGRGSAGAALLFAELAAENGDERDAETALAFLDAALDRAAEDRPNALLYPGTVGVGWALAHLEGSLVDEDPDENDVDVLVDQALTANWPSADLIRGVAGTGVYLLERQRSTKAMVDRLAAMSTTTDQGITWFVDPETCLPDRRAAYPHGYYDVGMAHGQAGCLAVLAHALAAGDESARPLLEGATAWTLAQRLTDGPGCYPTLVPNDARPPHGGRVAWCYGDPGVAAGLLAAGRALGDERVVNEAVDVALTAAARTDDHGVVDAPLCHGSAGLMHVFSRLHQQVQDERLADAARYWYGIAVHQRMPGKPVAGYGSMRPDGDLLTYEPLAGFLEGATGVALALLAATSERDYGWDALLLTKPVP
jgi:lantibiotic modifying enzyme